MTYELVYPDGQETQKVSLVEARKIASDFIGHNVEHLPVGGTRKTYKVRTALFDPTRGIVLTAYTGETFVHVMLRKPGKPLPPPSVGAKKGKPKAQKPKCTCGECKTCRNREHQRSFYNRNKAKARPRKSSRKVKLQKKAATDPPTKLRSLPEKNVRTGIGSMFRAGMTISEIAGIFEVPPEFIEGLLREMF